LEAAAAERRSKPAPPEDISRVFDRFFSSESPTSDKGPSSDIGPLLDEGPAQTKGPIRRKGPARKDGPAKSASLALQIDGPLPDVGPSPYTGPTPDFSLLTSLPDVDGFVFWFHQLTDYLCRQLTPPEQAIYLQLYRLSWGFGGPRCIVGFPKLAERSGMSESGARLAATGLIKKGLVRKLGMVFGRNVEQGIEWEVFEPPALIKFRTSRNKGPASGEGPTSDNGPSRRTPIKDLKEKENTQTQTSVSVGSRFTLEECRKFADHLKKSGQGITNPGGYATTIFRTGEADEIIEAFLNPPATNDFSNCPDCAGQGWYYPEGFDKGAKRCKHQRLHLTGS